MSGSEAFFQAVEILTLVQRSVKHAPNPFNMQQSRAVVLTGAKHLELWQKIKETYIKTLGGDQEKIDAAIKKIDAQYVAGYGTIAFFEDQDVIKAWNEKMPVLGEAFAVWSENAAGILQYIVWTAIEAEGMGANLQHYGAYSPETQSAITTFLGVPAAWKSTALMPFGIAVGGPGNAGHPKAFAPVEDRVKALFG